MTFRPKRSSGIDRKAITVITDPPTPGGRLYIQATIIQAIHLEPNKITSLIFTDNNPVNKIFKVLNGEKKNFEIQNIRYDTNCLKVVTDKYPGPNIKKFEYIVNVTLFPDCIKTKAKHRNFTETIKIKTLYGKKSKDLNFNIYGFTHPEIYLEPRNIDNLKLTDNNPVKKTFKVLSGVNKNFKIQNITYDTNCFKVVMKELKLPEKKIPGYIMDLTIFPEGIKAKAKQKKFTEIINIKTLYGRKLNDLNFYIIGFTH